ncbi:O-acetylhomoserine aminocarboxypropyltransferase/cysteine synthase family protein [Lawsonella clevelandensis]|uniref:L-methionine gamma-lyase n=1 Tax=Lawsonella clevelandensis TaxID=1528099 RepID=A0A5E3ZZG4_9ACTN|nr:aminotransferase class I/II-fold pyridoxal phosphate-dependent enzyme [Lawsonella clevelandensis]VHO01218.1 L-methionine gamma-lyase [Lawsonella clevelandensis]
MTTKYDNSNASNWNFTTQSVHAGQGVDNDVSARNLPIYLSSSFVFDSAEHAANRFNLSDTGPVYSRLTNPTVDALENRLAVLEGGVAAVGFSSGAAAITNGLQTVVQAGGHIVASPRLYGGTENLLHHTLPKYGIEVTFVENPDDPQSWQDAVQPNTKVFYGETISNPANDVFNIPVIAEIAHRNNVPLFIDNTLATPYLVRPLQQGADIVAESLTKFIGGHGSALGGVLVDGGNFDWAVEKDGTPVFPSFVTPDPSYHGLVYKDLGAAAFALKVRVSLLRDTGATLSAFNAWVIQQGVETLALRVRQHVTNAQQVAEWLDQQDLVEKVHYAGLPSSPWYQVGTQVTPEGAGSVLAFDIKGGKDEAWSFIDALKLHSNLANVGDVRSLVAHPATTTHSQLTDEELLAAGITPSTIRLSVGIEDVEDIIGDLKLGFAAITQ